MATAAQRKRARDLRRIGWSSTQIAEDLGVHASTVRRWTLDMPNPVYRRRVSFDIQEDMRALREVGCQAGEIQREIEKAHGVRLSTNTIYSHLKRMGLGGRIEKMQPDELRRFRKALRQSVSTVDAVADRFGVSYGYARKVRSETIASGGFRKKPAYTSETKARCVAIADRCGSTDRASRMIRAVAGRGPSGAAIRNWRRERGRA